MARTAAAMPRKVTASSVRDSQPLRVVPIVSRLAAMRSMNQMSGTAMTPLNTAANTRAWIGLTPRADIGADVDQVRGREQDHQHAQGTQAVVVLDVARQPLAGDVADPAAGFLHRGHQRIHPHGRPQLAIAELGAGLGVGRDPGRVIIGRPGHQARAQYADQVTQPGTAPAGHRGVRLASCRQPWPFRVVRGFRSWFRDGHSAASLALAWPPARSTSI